MTDKQFRVLAAVFVVLLALLLLARWNTNRAETPTSAPLDLATLKDSGVDKITVASSDSSVTLTRTSSGWRVEESAADTTTINTLFKTLGSAKFAEVVSTNPANQEVFGVSGPAAKTLTFYKDDEKKAMLVVGNPGDTPQTYYVKVGGRKEVWSVSGDFAPIAATAEAWRAKPKPAAKPKPPAQPAK